MTVVKVDLTTQNCEHLLTAVHIVVQEALMKQKILLQLTEAR